MEQFKNRFWYDFVFNHKSDNMNRYFPDDLKLDVVDYAYDMMNQLDMEEIELAHNQPEMSGSYSQDIEELYSIVNEIGRNLPEEKLQAREAYVKEYAKTHDDAYKFNIFFDKYLDDPEKMIKNNENNKGLPDDLKYNLVELFQLEMENTPVGWKWAYEVNTGHLIPYNLNGRDFREDCELFKKAYGFDQEKFEEKRSKVKEFWKGERIKDLPDYEEYKVVQEIINMDLEKCEDNIDYPKECHYSKAEIAFGMTKYRDLTPAEKEALDIYMTVNDFDEDKYYEKKNLRTKNNYRYWEIRDEFKELNINLESDEWIVLEKENSNDNIWISNGKFPEKICFSTDELVYAMSLKNEDPQFQKLANEFLYLRNFDIEKYNDKVEKRNVFERCESWFEEISNEWKHQYPERYEKLIVPENNNLKKWWEFNNTFEIEDQDLAYMWIEELTYLKSKESDPSIIKELNGRMDYLNYVIYNEGNSYPYEEFEQKINEIERIMDYQQNGLKETLNRLLDNYTEEEIIEMFEKRYEEDIDDDHDNEIDYGSSWDDDRDYDDDYDRDYDDFDEYDDYYDKIVEFDFGIYENPDEYTSEEIIEELLNVYEEDELKQKIDEVAQERDVPDHRGH